MGTLYIVPTPIGNLEDITLRALRILKEVRLIAAEDTRTSRVLLQHYEITTPLTSYHEHNKQSKLEAVAHALEIGDVALISDAGTPGISDPGYELVQFALAHGIPVVPLPGANAVLPALVASGLPADSFIFLGFLPKKTTAKVKFLQSHIEQRHTLIVYDSPHRLIDTLECIQQVYGERQICVAREISKKYEEFVRGTVTEVTDYFASQNPRGEITLVIAGNTEPEQWDESQVRRILQSQLENGTPLSRAAKDIAKQSGWRKKRNLRDGIRGRKWVRAICHYPLIFLFRLTK